MISASGETAINEHALEEATGQLRLLQERGKISQNMLVNNGDSDVHVDKGRGTIGVQIFSGFIIEDYCQSTQGIILPGATTDITFSFVSELAGVFTETGVLRQLQRWM